MFSINPIGPYPRFASGAIGEARVLHASVRVPSADVSMCHALPSRLYRFASARMIAVASSSVSLVCSSWSTVHPFFSMKYVTSSRYRG